MIKSEIVQINNNEFLKVQLIPFNQKKKSFFIAKLPAAHLLRLYTVEPAEYDINRQTALASEFKDDMDYYNYLVDEDKKRIESKAFQRKEDKKRVSEIKDFLNEEEYALFPNTIIVTCDLANDLLDLGTVGDFLKLDPSQLASIYESGVSFLENTNGTYCLYIPNHKKSILIIDGQHRVRGIENTGEEVINSYELLVTFVIGYDRATLAKLFYTINYTQKSVNKSLLYHLTGEFSRNVNEITFMHETVKILNELNYSPFHKRIKMLGYVSENLPMEERRMMTVSQAFLVDYLVNTISEKAKNSLHPPIFLFYYQKRELQIEIIRFLIKYFSAIRSIKEKEWDNPLQSTICKSVSIGAFIKLMHFIFVKMFLDDFQMEPNAIIDLKKEDIVERLKGLENVDFSKGGELDGIGGAGGLNRVKEKLILKLDYFPETRYDEFLANYKVKYLEPFKQWIS